MLVGHEKQSAILEAMRGRDAMAHAFLVTGPTGVGKKAFAVTTARWLQGKGSFADYRASEAVIHPDIIELRAPTIKEVRNLRSVVARAPYSAPVRSVIVDDAHELGAEATNALLKTLEEPRSNTIFFLLATNANRVLPTISSRCYHMPLGLVKDGYEIPEPLTSLAYGRPQRALEFLNNSESATKAREAVRAAERFARGTIRDRFAIIDAYCEEGAPLNLFVEALIGILRGSRVTLQSSEALRGLLSISARLQTGNASPAWMLRSFALRISPTQA